MKNGKESKIPYYLGLDIGTNSVGYAVTDRYYMPLKKKGEPAWGVTTFEEATTAAERRAHRTSRRRIDRVQQRVALVDEIFAPYIAKKDPRYFIRRKESALYRDETEDAYTLFADEDFTDAEYYRRYPTIHHLLVELMQSGEPHDVRLVHIACAWLVSHRGHFLFDVPAENTAQLLDFGRVYNDLRTYLAEEQETAMPWPDTSESADKLLEVLRANKGVTAKKELFVESVCGGKKPEKKPDETCKYSREAVIKLLCGATVKPEEIFQEGEYLEVDSVKLSMPDEDFARIVAELGDNGTLLLKLRALADCALLIVAQNNKPTVSEAKVEVYEQHAKDLNELKKFVKKYAPEKYSRIFRAAVPDNYVAYSRNAKDCAAPPKKWTGKEAFCDFLKKEISEIEKNAVIRDEDTAFLTDMKERLSTCTFLPKQKDTDNRVIPQQLYRHEMKLILDKAESYLPMLGKRDETGLTNKEKLLSIFDFRIPYFVGPLRRDNCEHAWIVRKAEGKIYPWNFTEKVDLDASEQAFIQRLTNTCSYVAGAEVLPAKSLLYSKFAVLNQINPLKVNGVPVPVEVKQSIYTDVLEKNTRVTLKKIKDYLVSSGRIMKTDELSGIDEKLTSTLASRHWFSRLLSSGMLSENDVESIICRAAYSEDKSRFLLWLGREFPKLSKEDRSYIAGLNLKEFGRLSGEFLTGVLGAKKSTGEAFTIIEALWETNCNLMQLLSDEFTFTEAIEERNREYYAEHPVTVSERLDEMYISNAVKRPIIRTLDICDDIDKAFGYAPEKVFVEMARDASGDQKGKRTQTRKQQLLDLYKRVKTEDARTLEKELAAMGEKADNRLQSDKLFLYYLQLGKCAYTGRPIELSKLSDGTYNVDHIYPQAFVKDDSLLNNKVLVDSKVNGDKKNVYPVDAAIRSRMSATWEYWRFVGLMTDEKYRRLMRPTPFTDDEKWGFINRQLVETRQSTKAVAELLKERWPDTEVVYVKAGLVSEFRQEFDLLKSRLVNDLHHAKDAYLNIVVGNVYNSRFNKRWFVLDRDYSVRTKTIFSHTVKCGMETVWQGETDIAKVKNIIHKNNIHVTRYAFCRKGGLFDQQPLKKSETLINKKKDLPASRYGGYDNGACSFFYLAGYEAAKKTGVMLVPVDLTVAERCDSEKEYADHYVKLTMEKIIGKQIGKSEILMNGRKIKINSMISVDGLRMVINGKSSGGRQIIVALSSPLKLDGKMELYIKHLEMFLQKKKENPSILLSEEHDKITRSENEMLYALLTQKMSQKPYSYCPGNQGKVLEKGKDRFVALSVEKQIEVLINIVTLFSPQGGCVDLTAIGGAKSAGAKLLNAQLNNWKNYKDVCIVDSSPSGIYEKRSGNLLDLL